MEWACTMKFMLSFLLIGIVFIPISSRADKVSVFVEVQSWLEKAEKLSNYNTAWEYEAKEKLDRLKKYSDSKFDIPYNKTWSRLHVLYAQMLADRRARLDNVIKHRFTALYLDPENKDAQVGVSIIYLIFERDKHLKKFKQPFDDSNLNTKTDLYKVFFVNQEYLLLQLNKLKHHTQALVEIDGIMTDKFEVVDEGGQRYSVFFDIDEVFHMCVFNETQKFLGHSKGTEWLESVRKECVLNLPLAKGVSDSW